MQPEPEEGVPGHGLPTSTARTRETVRVFANDMFERASLAALCETRGYRALANDHGETVPDSETDIAIISADGYARETFHELVDACVSRDIRTIVIEPDTDPEIANRVKQTGAAAVVTRDTAAYYLGQILGLVRNGVRILRDPPRFPIRTERPAAVPGLTLTDREAEVLSKIIAGHPNKVIARELGISEGTARIHTKNIMRKCGAVTRTQVAIWSLKGEGGDAETAERRPPRTSRQGHGSATAPDDDLRGGVPH